MSEWPATSNFFGSLHTSLSRQAVAGLYRSCGWSIRLCGCADFEIRCAFAELLIESNDPVLIHGLVVDVTANADEIMQPLHRAGVPHTVELYGANGELLRQVKSG